MENEMSFFAKIGIRLNVSAVILFILLIITSLGINMMRDTTRVVDRAYVGVHDYEWAVLVGYDDEMPAASMYSLILKDEGKLNSISGTAHGITVTDYEDLLKLLSKEISCTITDTGFNTFDVIVANP